MQRRGRRVGFLLGAVGGGVGSALCALAWCRGRSGSSCSARFSPGSTCRRRASTASPATDGADEAFRPRAISYGDGRGAGVGGRRAAAGEADRRRAGAGAVRRRLRRRGGAEPGGRLALRAARQPAAGAARRGRAAGTVAAGAAADAADRGRDDLRDGDLRADEPGDDLDAARHGRLRLRDRGGGERGVGACRWRCSRRRSSPAR